MAENKLIPVYLFGPIGEGRVNEPVLQVIRDTIEENLGEVLTPHVADWETAIALRQDLGWDGLYDFDAQQLQNAVLGIGEVSYPSTGVGREIERLLNFRRPVIAFRGVDKSYKSALIDGERNPRFILALYENLEDLKQQTAGFMQRVDNLLTPRPKVFVGFSRFELNKIRRENG